MSAPSPRDPHRTIMNRTHRSAALVAAGLAIAVLLLPAAVALRAPPAPALRPGASESQTVTVGSAFAFTPSSFEVTPGDNVTLTVEQLDGVEHTFTLSAVAGFEFQSSNTTQDILNFFSAHPPLVNIHLNGTSGERHTVTFLAPPLGKYEYVCEIAGHFQAGMFGFMGSGVAVGPPPGPPLPVALYIITGVIVAAVVLAVVLGFVIGQREGARHEMPAERLGYSEPLRPPETPPTRPLGPS